MSYSQDLGLLARAQAQGRAVVVAMEDVRFLTFNEDFSAIGAKSLGGCSVVAVVSPQGAILAHIPPLPTVALNPFAGDRNVQRMMDEVRTRYFQYNQYFPAAEAFVVCAVHEGKIALPDQKRIIERNLQDIDLTCHSIQYVIPNDRKTAGQGTVFVDSLTEAGQLPLIYVEDRLVSRDCGYLSSNFGCKLIRDFEACN
jgi:hypothetical protein